VIGEDRNKKGEDRKRGGRKEGNGRGKSCVIAVGGGGG